MGKLRKNWSVDAGSFGLLLNALNSENEDLAGSRYEEVRAMLLRYFRGRGSDQPEENTDEVFDRVARKLSNGADLDLAAHNGYFLQVARFVLSEYFRANRYKVVSLDDSPEAARTSSDVFEEAERLKERIKNEIGLDALRHCREELPDSQKDVLDVYDKGKGREKIERRDALAIELGKSKGALIVEVSRIRAKLRDCAKKKLRELGLLA